MDVTRFTAPAWGRVVSTGGSHGYPAFRPEPLPRVLPLDGPTVLSLSEADAALGRLAGAGRLLPAPQLLVTPYLAREAVASSRIEGTQASLTDVFEAGARVSRPTEDLREVRNYIAAVEHGVRRLDDLPLSLRLLRECHEILLSGVRGEGKTPGDVRTSQNWIGGGSGTIEDALFVPPPPGDVGDALSAWERYIHDDDPQLPLLVRCGLLHYQFETIHPFLDGNGRLGRLFVILHLLAARRLPAPLLYVSAEFERSRPAYYDRLQGVRERGEVQLWLRFFLDAVTRQATDAVARAETIVDLREDFRSRLRGRRSRATEVVDLLVANPIITAPVVAEALSVTNQGASLLLRQLVDVDIVDAPVTAPGRASRYSSPLLLAALLRDGEPATSQ